MQNDVKNCRAERLAPHIVRLLKGSTDQPTCALLVAALTGWDCRYDLASAAPALFETFMAPWNSAMCSAVHLPARLLDLTVQQTGLASSLLEGEVPDYFPAGTAAQRKRLREQTVAHLRERLGREPAGWAWREVHLAHWQHPLSSPALETALDIGPAPVDGGSHTLRNTGGELPPHMASVPARSIGSSQTSPTLIDSWPCKTSATRACPAARIIVTSSSPGSTARITRCCCSRMR